MKMNNRIIKNIVQQDNNQKQQQDNNEKELQEKNENEQQDKNNENEQQHNNEKEQPNNYEQQQQVTQTDVKNLDRINYFFIDDEIWNKMDNCLILKNISYLNTTFNTSKMSLQNLELRKTE
ncbi:unnamed protein product [Paramecium octaurelia]|uniref:Uncharacterized protein n=1 Tax=Paramecium octaurelia TaxID=43137 RepID=A0A8S1YSY5_PAROT|nr:unnamed protein product [Paramecium octaurelia]